MSRFGAALCSRRLPRIFVIAGFLPLGLLGILSSGAVVMTAIALGARRAAEDSLFAFGLLILLSAVTGANLGVVALSALGAWGIAWWSGSLVGKLRSLNLPLQILVLVAIAGQLLFALLVSDPVAYWMPVLKPLAAELAEMSFTLLSDGDLEAFAPSMAAVVAVGSLLSSVLALLLGAWWAGGSGGPNPGEMFTRLRLGIVLGLVAAAAGLASGLTNGPLAGGVLAAVSTGFAFQGLAVLHFQYRRRDWPLALLYWPLVLGLFVPQAALLLWLALAAVGFIDNWYGLRRAGADVIK